MFWNDRKLLEWAENGGITPFELECINPTSIDLRWSGRLRVATEDGWGDVRCENSITLVKGFLYLLDTMEYIRMPENAMGWLALKSSMGRLGLEHLHAGLFDPGFHGTATLEMHVIAPWGLEIMKGQRIVQLALASCEYPIRSYKYTGRYNGQSEPQEAK